MIALVAISGCTRNENNKAEIKTLDKAPNSLEDVYKDISSVLDGAGQIERINLNIDFEDKDESTDLQEDKGPSSEEETESQDDTQTDESSNSESENQNSDDEESDDKEPQESDEASNEEDMDKKLRAEWVDIDKSLENIYLGWSDYESEAIKKGASKERVLQLKDSINKLTKSVEERDIVDIYEFASQSLVNLKPFFDLYKDDYRGEICDLKHSTYQYYIKAVTGDKEAALSAVEGKEENINRIRLLIGDDEKKVKELEKLSTQLENLGISLEDDSKRVHILEKDTLIKNLESLE